MQKILALLAISITFNAQADLITEEKLHQIYRDCQQEQLQGLDNILHPDRPLRRFYNGHDYVNVPLIGRNKYIYVRNVGGNLPRNHVEYSLDLFHGELNIRRYEKSYSWEGPDREFNEIELSPLKVPYYDYETTVITSYNQMGEAFETTAVSSMTLMVFKKEPVVQTLKNDYTGKPILRGDGTPFTFNTDTYKTCLKDHVAFAQTAAKLKQLENGWGADHNRAEQDVYAGGLGDRESASASQR
jgi:hypothetical protein